MLTFFYVCFGVGAGYAVISFILGGLMGALNIDADLDFGSDAGIDFDAGMSAGGFPSPFKPVVFAVFLTVFGGVGILTLVGMGAVVALSMAGAIGFAASFLFYRFVIVTLYRMQNTSAVEKKNLIGVAAKVTEYIPQGKFGKITYYVNGNTYSAPAKSEDGTAISRHENVKIVYIERSIFFVRKALPLRSDEAETFLIN